MWKTKISWNQIFSLISPYLLDKPTDSKAKELLSKVIYEVTPNFIDKGIAKLIDQDFQTIKIQLKALGLIDLNYTKTNAGGMDLFWHITEKGEQLMLHLRSVKK
ncbi:hypothetical protein [Flavobacterium piscinae]|uniref:hypothetical protein n=1 Tax=Flavobacterium piscinae TaxID=2506424 RepID=UPI001C9E1F07|nr:hypothetical protein [Flavobacterium piscinae]